jgi:hypothetical protein
MKDFSIEEVVDSGLFLSLDSGDSEAIDFTDNHATHKLGDKTA